MRRTDAQSLNTRIKDYVTARIHSGECPEGHRIPSEIKLCETFQTSRMTVNRAVRELTEMGYLTRAQGAGTFVADVSIDATMLEIRSIRQEIEDRGGTHSSRVLTLIDQGPPDSQAEQLGFAPGTPVAYLESLHKDRATPIQFERRYVNLELAPEFTKQDFTMTTASDYLLTTLGYTEVDHMIAAVGATGQMAQHLQIDEGTPCLQLTRKTRMGQVLITHVDLVHPGHEFRLSGRIPLPSAMRRAAS